MLCGTPREPHVWYLLGSDPGLLLPRISCPGCRETLQRVGRR
jgi:hypothetical protein